MWAELVTKVDTRAREIALQISRVSCTLKDCFISAMCLISYSLFSTDYVPHCSSDTPLGDWMNNVTAIESLRGFSAVYPRAFTIVASQDPRLSQIDVIRKKFSQSPLHHPGRQS
jgi:hypothetical protein